MHRSVPLFALTALTVAPFLAHCGADDAISDDRDATTFDASDDGATGDTGTSEDGSSLLSDAGPLPLGDAATTPCWPYDRPSVAALHASQKKVFAHYFSPYPISLDNKPPASDYYAVNYLLPTGEGGKFSGNGALLRERPIPQTPWPGGTDYVLENSKIEVRRAVAIGLDGFTYDLLSSDAASVHRTRLEKLLQAIPLVDPAFKIHLVFDMTASSFGGGGGTDDAARTAILAILKAYGNDPSILRVNDGRIVASAFGAEKRSAAFWIDVEQQAKSAGYEIALMPMPIGSWAGSASNFATVPLFGASSWGIRTVSGASALKAVPAAVHSQGLIWMAPVAPQDSRPKEFTFVESDNSGAFRAQWDAAIQGGADWVQLITWNDYSEDSEVAPSTKTGNAFYDLSGYYTTWLKTGVQPTILRDALYGYHRAHSMDVAVAPPNLSKQTKAFAAVNGPTTSSNQIELVAFLTAPGTLEISVGGKTSSSSVAAGIQTFKIPLAEGTPVFRLVRGGKKVVEVTSATAISNTIVYQDPLYHGTTSLTCAP